MKKNFKSTFKRGDLIWFYDSLCNRPIWGYVIDTYRGYDGYNQDIIIRWNDVFVATQNCTAKEVIGKIKLGQWKYWKNL
jgi:hypothetical protein